MLILLQAISGLNAQDPVLVFGGGYEGQPVVDVVLDGNVLVAHELLMANMKTRPGSVYTAEHIDDDMRWMTQSYGVYPEVNVEQVPDGVIVTFKLVRVQHYDQVEFEGNGEFSDSRLRGVGLLPSGGRATPEQVASALLLIREFYLSKGYPFIQVNHKDTSSDKGEFRSTIRIFEGPEVEVASLRLIGLTAVDENDARDLLSSQPGFWSWLVGKDFVRSEVDRDTLVLEDYVRREGYLDASVSLDPLEWSDDRTKVVVSLNVDQGSRYFVRSVTVAGNTDLTGQELLKNAALTVGDPYRAPDVSRVLRSMRDLYGHDGFIDVSIRPVETFDLEEPLLDLEWRVDEGRQKRVRDVIVHGNVGTRDGVVRRYMTVYPGDIIDTRELRYSEDALISLGYFTDLSGVPKVRVTTEPTDDPGLVDVVVNVDDASSGIFTFVFGAGSDSGVFAGVTVDKRNFDISRAASSWKRFFQEFFERGEAFHGGGQSLLLEVIPGTETTQLDIVFNDPWLDESAEDPWGLTVEVYDRRRIYSDYTQASVGTGVFFDHQFSREVSLSLGPRLENVNITDIDDEAKDFVTGQGTEFAKAEGRHSRHVMEAALSFTALDSLFDPTEGVTSQLRIENVGGPFGGDIDAVRGQLSAEAFFPMGEDEDGNMNVFHPRFSLGVVEGTGDSEELPFFENFFVGGGSGPFAVRGFAFQGVGPHQRMRSTQLGPVLDDNSGSAVGGRLAAVASLEALFPLVTDYNAFRDRDETMVKGVLFVDAGNLLGDTDWDELMNDIRLSAGAGVRLKMPALGGITIRMDWAMVLAEKREDETRPLSFELSRRF
ncbi:MAG: BamA/TamA family outer membrane protein [Planctomycetota bacterium]|jgi:outer membrane protein insertion porin family|nr:BamA/TamA family outer membrane protein [Planctomycetota bacterium]